jgi:hypothetical protein
MRESQVHWSSHLPFYYGWLIVGIVFVTMAIGVTARTALKVAAIRAPNPNRKVWTGHAR